MIADTLRRRIAIKRGSDRADSNIITFILIFPLFFSFLVTMIDTSMYFANRSTIQQVARDGTRQAAIFGGPGNGELQSKLEQSYTTGGATCGTHAANGSPVECAIYSRLTTNAGLTNVNISKVACGLNPTGGDNRTTLSFGSFFSTNSIGETITCQILWEFGGIPGSARAFMQHSKMQDTRVTAQTEVRLDANDIVER